MAGRPDISNKFQRQAFAAFAVAGLLATGACSSDDGRRDSNFGRSISEAFALEVPAFVDVPPPPEPPHYPVSDYARSTAAASDGEPVRRFRAAQTMLRSGEPGEAASDLQTLEDDYPHLRIAKTAHIWRAYALILDGDLDESDRELDRFITFYPADADIDYIYFLKADAEFRRIAAIGRDSKRAEDTFMALNAFQRRFPDSDYVKEVTTKALRVAEVIAANHLSIGRYYQDRGEYLAAINRFQLVARKFPETTLGPEAMHRLVESFAALGMVDEARRTAVNLASRYGDSDWAMPYRRLTASLPAGGGKDPGAPQLAEKAEGIEPALPADNLARPARSVVGKAVTSSPVMAASYHSQPVSPGPAAKIRRQVAATSLVPAFGSGAESETTAKTAREWLGYSRGRIREQIAPQDQLASNVAPENAPLRFESGVKDLEVSLDFKGETKEAAGTSAVGSSWQFGESQESGLRLTEEDEWTRKANFRGDLRYSDQFSMKLESDFQSRRDWEEERIGSFLVDPGEEWTENTINKTRLTFGFFDDRLRFSSDHRASRSAGSDTGGEARSGQGFQQGIGFDAWRRDGIEVSFFGSYSEADESFKNHKIGKKKDDKISNPFDEGMDFAAPGKALLHYGSMAKLGPITLNLAQQQTWSKQGEGHFENEYETGLSVSVDEAVNSIGFEMGHILSALAPDTIAVKYGFGEATNSSGKSGPRDRKKSLSLSGDWTWDGGYGGVSYWRWLFDNREPGAEAYDEVGDGVSIYMGLYRDTWSIDGGIGYDRTDSYGEWNRSWETALDTWVSFGYRPETDLPTFSVSASTNRWQADYTSSDGTSLYDSWSITNEVGFSRFVDDWFGWDPEASSLSFIFELAGDGQSEKWSGVSSEDTDIDVFFGITGKVGLYD